MCIGVSILCISRHPLQMSGTTLSVSSHSSPSRSVGPLPGQANRVHLLPLQPLRVGTEQLTFLLLQQSVVCCGNRPFQALHLINLAICFSIFLCHSLKQTAWIKVVFVLQVVFVCTNKLPHFYKDTNYKV